MEIISHKVETNLANLRLGDITGFKTVALVCLKTYFNLFESLLTGYVFNERERKTKAFILVMPAMTEGGQIHLNITAIPLAPLIHKTSSLLKSTLLHSCDGG